MRQCVGARVLENILVLGCEVKAFAELKVSKQFLENKHYYMHKRKPFYRWLIDFVGWGNLVVLIMEGDNIIRKVRDLLGPTRVEQAVVEKPLSLRARYGMFEGVNVGHASDSISSSKEEISVWKQEYYDLNYETDAYEKAMSYISMYSGRTYVDTILYRKIADELRNTPNIQKDLERKTAGLLHMESPGTEETRLNRFANVLIRAILICTAK